MIKIDIDTIAQIVYVGCKDCAYYLPKSGLCCESRSPWYKTEVLGKWRLCRCFTPEPLSGTLLRVLRESGHEEDIRW